MLTDETQRLLKNLLIELGKGEQATEAIRQRLASIDDSTSKAECGSCGGPYTAFQRIDRNRDDFITAEEIVQFLKENRHFDVGIEEVRYIVDFFDCDEDRKLSYSE